MEHRFGRRAAALAAALALAAGVSPAFGPAASAAPRPPATPVTAAVDPPTGASAARRSETAKLDAVATPKLSWYRCLGTAECTTVKVPRDYDKPKGAKVELALLRLKARDRKNRIGSLFVNPGGPGGSATQLAYFSDGILSEDVLDRFDIVGMDPRGIAFSDNVTCLTPRTQEAALAGYGLGFPIGSVQEKAWMSSDRALGAACSKDTLARSMSTAEVARDMELMRRAVGDSKLTYLGLSYGTYLGQVYAAMFPNRFRAVAVDGVLDPVAWAGDSRNAGRPLEARLDSASGAWKALREILVRCDRAGGARCSFAAGDPVANLRTIADRLKFKPIVFEDPEFGERFTFTYQDMVLSLLGALYDPAGYASVVELLSALWVASEPPNPAARASAQRAGALEHLAAVRRAASDGSDRPRFGPGRGFPYDNSYDAFASVACTDSKETTRLSQFPGFAKQADRKAPLFGRAWLWTSSVCAGDTFTGEDEDAYRGRFDVKTKAPVLYVGNYYDPATNYDAAVSASKRLPGSRLLSSDSFGHTAYGSSECVTRAMDLYLLRGTLPKKGKVCVGDLQPFESEEADLDENERRQQALARELPGPFPTRR